MSRVLTAKPTTKTSARTSKEHKPTAHNLSVKAKTHSQNPYKKVYNGYNREKIYKQYKSNPKTNKTIFTREICVTYSNKTKKLEFYVNKFLFTNSPTHL
jgi:hypothetical protein